MEGLGERLKRLRVSRNLSVRQLAAQAGVSVSYIYAIEAGMRGHSIEKLERIADALSVPLNELWAGSEQ